MIQSADVDGHDATSSFRSWATEHGRSAEVTPTLTLYLPPEGARTRKGYELLDPKSRAIQFIGRERELDATARLAREREAVAVRVRDGQARGGQDAARAAICANSPRGWMGCGIRADSASCTRFLAAAEPRELGLAAPHADRDRLRGPCTPKQIQDWLRELGLAEPQQTAAAPTAAARAVRGSGQGWWQTAFGPRQLRLTRAFERHARSRGAHTAHSSGRERSPRRLDAILEQAGSGLRAPTGTPAARPSSDIWSRWANHSF